MTNVTQNIKLAFHGVENIVGKAENAGNQHFLLFPQCFYYFFSFSGDVKSCHCVAKGSLTNFEN